MEINQRIILLDVGNWKTWKHKIKVLLLHYRTWEFVKDVKNVATENPNMARKLRKDRAYTLIYLSLSNEFKPLIANATDGAKAWKILSDHFELTTRARVIQLLDNFFSIKYVPGENIGLFLCRVKLGAECLHGVGHQLQPLYLGYQMIRSLPKEFQASVQVIYWWKDQEFISDKIEAELVLEENCLKLSQKDFGNAESVYSSEARKDTGNSYKSKNAKQKVGPCFFCKKGGHLIANCRLRLNSEKAV